MKNWLNNVLGGQEKPEAPLVATQAAATDAPRDAHAIQAAEAQVPAEWKVGDVILDLYEVKQVHEGGGMGLVYRVHHRGWNMDLAVKSPRAEYFQTENQKEDFTRECETWIKLGLHPHIASCHYVRTLGGIPCVFAEYVQGGSLKEWIGGDGADPSTRKLYHGGSQEVLKRILDIAIQMAWGLHYAHEQGVVHQDIKPANVLMLPDGTAKITDFGLARARAAVAEPVAGSAIRSILVSTGGMTPAYCSPEQASGKALSHKTDLWSWAVSVLEMFMGEVCWRSGVAAPEVLSQVSKVRAEGVTLPEMPGDLEKLLAECFAPEPSERPASALVLAESLMALCRKLGECTEREEPQTAALQPDSLNNRAASLLDLGREEEADVLLEESLAVHPGHLQATYNRGLRRWRTGRETHEALVVALQPALQDWPNDSSARHLLGSVHLERGDGEAAVKFLAEAVRLNGGPEVERALADARRLELCGPRFLRAFKAPKQQRHLDNYVNSVALSADGQWALSGHADSTLRRWELRSGQCLGAFGGHAASVASVALSADGRWALSGSWDHTMRLWEVSSGKCLRTFEGIPAVLSVALSADGRWALLGCHEDKTLRLWELGTAECPQLLEGHRDEVTSVALSADGRRAFSGSRDRTLRLWDLTSRELGGEKCLRTFQGHTGSVTSVALSADGGWALSAGEDTTLRLWELDSGKCLRTFWGHTNIVYSVALSADGRLALSAGADNTLRLWQLSTGKALWTFFGHSDSVKSVALGAGGHLALSGGLDGSIRLWDSGGPTWDDPMRRAPWAICRPVETGAASAARKRFCDLLVVAEQALASGHASKSWHSLHAARSLPGYEFSSKALDLARRVALRGRRCGLRGVRNLWASELHVRAVEAVEVSEDWRWVLSGSHLDNTLRLLDLSSGRCLSTLEGPLLARSADWRWALCANPHDNTLRLWELSSGKCLQTFQGHTDSVRQAALSADGRFALSGSSDKTLRLWELSSGKCLHTFQGHTDSVDRATLSPDGRFALSGSSDKTLRLWELSSGKCLHTFQGHTDSVDRATLSPDGRFALSESSRDYSVRLWELSSGRCLKTFEGSIIAIRADWRRALLERGSTLQLLDLASGALLRTFEALTNNRNFLALSADWRWVIPAPSTADHTLALRELESGKCLRTLQGHTAIVFCVALSPDGRFALSGGDDKTLRLWDLCSGKCLRIIELDEERVKHLALSRDGRWALSVSEGGTFRSWALDWEYEFPASAEWDDGATPYLETFVALHRDQAARGIVRSGKPTWTEEEFQQLLTDLSFRGYGWLLPEGVRRKVGEIAREMNGAASRWSLKRFFRTWPWAGGSS